MNNPFFQNLGILEDICKKDNTASFTHDYDYYFVYYYDLPYQRLLSIRTPQNNTLDSRERLNLLKKLSPKEF